MFALLFTVFTALSVFCFASSKDEGVAVRAFTDLLKERVGNDAEQAINALKEESFSQV